MNTIGDVLRISYLWLLGSLGALALLVGNASSAQPSCSSYPGLPQEEGDKPGMVFVEGGSFVMGSDRQRPEERSSHVVKVDSFWIDQHEVTNAQFARFVGATGYKTLAERGVDPKTHQSLYTPGSVLFIQPTNFDGRGRTQWWKYVNGANWRAPEGPGSSIKGRENQPVVHVAYEDTLAYARWLSRELPSEAQWEFAARGGKQGDDWSQAFDADGKPTANSWQGVFPAFDTREDGYAGTAPVGCFLPNGYGLYDMIGNVWEWTNDWYVPGHPPEPVVNPTGPNILRVRLTPGASPSKVIKGGSYLCSPNFCSRYRSSARQPQEANLSAGHVGFRTVLNAPGP